MSNVTPWSDVYCGYPAGLDQAYARDRVRFVQQLTNGTKP